MSGSDTCSRRIVSCRIEKSQTVEAPLAVALHALYLILHFERAEVRRRGRHANIFTHSVSFISLIFSVSQEISLHIVLACFITPCYVKASLFYVNDMFFPNDDGQMLSAYIKKKIAT